MKRYWASFFLSLLLFCGVQSACLFTKTNIWLAQFIVLKQQQIQKILETKKQKQTEALAKKAREENKLKPWDKQVKDFTGLLSQLQTARDQQNMREQQLNALENQLKNEREALDTLKQSIEILQSELERRLVKIQASEIKNLKMLAESYTNMTPESVAKIFTESEESSVIKIMHFLAPETLGAILQVMTKEISKDEKVGTKINRLLESFRLSEEVKK
jgi:flagellar motility protein MotE (MotC chaperone)